MALVMIESPGSENLIALDRRLRSDCFSLVGSACRPGRLSGTSSEISIFAAVYDCAFARETLHRIENKTRLLEEVFIGLKPYCPLLLKDYFVAEGKENDPRLDDLMGREPGTAPFWSVPEAEKALGAMGFDLRISDDMTAQYRRDLFSDFARFVDDHDGKGIPPKMVEPLLRLAEFWGNRMVAIDEGLVTVHKFVVLRSEG